MVQFHSPPSPQQSFWGPAIDLSLCHRPELEIQDINVRGMGAKAVSPETALPFAESIKFVFKLGLFYSKIRVPLTRVGILDKISHVEEYISRTFLRIALVGIEILAMKVG